MRSPHYNARPKGRPVKLVVLHSDASKSEAATLAWFADPKSKVSYHILVGRDGTVHRVVEDQYRAWHAGVSSWPGVKDVNGESLGLSFANRHDGHELLTEKQIDAAKHVIANWRAKFGPLEVVTHAMVAPKRKFDPEEIPNFRLADYV